MKEERRKIIYDGTTDLAITLAGAAKVDGSAVNQPVVGNVASGAADSGNPVKVGAVVNTTAPSPTNGQRIDLQSDARGSLLVNPTSRKATYAASITYSPALIATDVLTLQGSASKKISIRSIEANATNSGNLNIRVDLVKRSATNTGGTSTVLTGIPFDSNDAAASGVCRYYTANPSSLGASLGILRTNYIFAPSLLATNATKLVDLSLGTAEYKMLTLNSTTEFLAINLGGTSITGTSVITLNIIWEEE